MMTSPQVAGGQSASFSGTSHFNDQFYSLNNKQEQPLFSNSPSNPQLVAHQNQSVVECQSMTNLNCSSQDLYNNIDFHPEEINFSDIQELWMVKDALNILGRVLLVTPIVLLGILGNLTIIYSMCKFKPFRTKPTNIFILNMAIADLLTTIVCPNAALFTYIYQFYVLGPFVCRIEGFVKITCFLVSSYSLIVLSSDWLLCVVQPCRKRITIKQSWFALITIWILSVTMAVPLLMWRELRHRQWKDLVEVWCCELIQYSKYYWVVITFFLIYLPTFFMTIVLVIILAQMDKFEAKLRRSRVSSPSSSSAGTSQSSQNSSLTLINMKYRRRIVKILFTYLLTSIICWTPLQVFIIYRHFRSEIMAAPWFFEFNFFTSLSASLTAATNPIIFGFLSQPFRKIVTKSLMFRFFEKLMTTNNESENQPNNNKNHEMRQPHHHHHHHNHNNQQPQQQQRHTHQHQQRGSSSRVAMNRKSPPGRPAKWRDADRRATNDVSRSNTANHQLSRPVNKKVDNLKSTVATSKKVSFKNSRRGFMNEAYDEEERDDRATDHSSTNGCQVEPGSNGIKDNSTKTNTTSFIQQQQQQQQQFRPMSVVSMDSINIEENLVVSGAGGSMNLAATRKAPTASEDELEFRA